MELIPSKFLVMKNNRLSKWKRVVVTICGAAIFSVLFIPFWEIQLDAPQYPEGLVLEIYTNKLGGNVDIINGLNHYIGMKTLHTEDFFEFTILPYLTAGFALLFIITGIVGRRKLLRFSFIAFLVFGIVAMADFWKWEYNYGHNLNPDAAIKVPGMAYQPPLIGYKQLLNFAAYSIPDIGGWIFIAAGAIVGIVMLVDIRDAKKIKIKSGGLKQVAVTTTVLLLVATSCNTKPEAFAIGKDNCDFCKMTIMDNKVGAELITQHGKIYKFDDVHCLLGYLKSGSIEKNQIVEIYFQDYAAPGNFIPASTSFLLSSESLHTPMNGNIAAFSNKDSMEKIRLALNGEIVAWNKLYY